MQTGRADYDQLFRTKHIPPDEPVFIIRARDALSAPAVRAYAALAAAAGADAALVELALQAADRMAAHPHPRLPDVDHLTEAERLQLAYRLERRAWAAGAAVPSLEAELAERRGFARGRRLARQLPCQGDWRPWSTAPLDGTGVLACGIHTSGDPRPVPAGVEGRRYRPGDSWWAILQFDVWRQPSRWVYGKDGDPRLPSEPLGWRPLPDLPGSAPADAPIVTVVPAGPAAGEDRP